MNNTDIQTKCMAQLPFEKASVKYVHGGKRLVEQTALIKKKPLISIITVVYNGVEHLNATIQSVLKQMRSDIEYIVVDGSSTDGTLGLLMSLDNQLDYWISEPDDGIYDAMNKALDLARGQFIYHLNIGDLLLCIPGVFTVHVPDDVVCVAGAVQTSASGLFMPSAGIGLRFHNTLHHQGCFYRNTVDLRYDLRYKVFADFDLNQRLLKGTTHRIFLCADIVATHDSGGISNTTNRFFEIYSIVNKNYGTLWAIVCFAYFKYRGLLNRLQIV
jgi:glycosyltransferase involved in cell wall biosynthesis